jgi:hypothetical protein
MKNTERREKVELLIYDLGSWLPRSNYKCILAFCDYELLQYGIDPEKGIENLLQDGIDYYDLSDPPSLNISYSIINLIGHRMKNIEHLCYYSFTNIVMA